LEPASEAEVGGASEAAWGILPQDFTSFSFALRKLITLVVPSRRQKQTKDSRPPFWDERQKSLLAVVASLISAYAGLGPLQLPGELKWQRALFLVLGALFRVELDFHLQLL
jgi:hypothetical protein